jgi:hypothetical protein
MNKPQAMRVERETIDQGPFGFAGFLTVISLELTQKDCRTSGVIDRIDRQRQPDAGQVDADLMGLAGPGKYAKKRELAKSLLDFPERPRRPTAVFDNRHHPLVRRVHADGGIDFAFIVLRPAHHQGEVLLLHRVVLELMRKMPLGCGVFGEEHDAAGVFVEAMDDEKLHVELRRQLLEHALVVAATGDGRQARGLVDGHDVRIFVENGQKRRFQI